MCLVIPGLVVEIVDPALRLAKVEVAGVRRTVNVGLLDDGDTLDPEAGARPGDWVLVHVGFAISRVDEAEAQATLSLLRGLAAAEDGLARCADGEGRSRAVETSLVGGVAPSDELLVHAAVALAGL